MREELLHILKAGPHTTTQTLEKLGFSNTAQRKKQRKRILYYFSKLQDQNKVKSRRNARTGEKTFSIQHKETHKQLFTETNLSLQLLEEAKRKGYVFLTSPSTPDAALNNPQKETKRVEDVITTTNPTQEKWVQPQNTYQTILLPLSKASENTKKITALYKETPRTTNIIYTWKPSKKYYSTLTELTKLSKEHNKKLYVLDTDYTEPYTIGKSGTYPLQHTQQTALLDVQQLLSAYSFSDFRILTKQLLIHIAQNIRRTNVPRETVIPLRLWNYTSKQNVPFSLIKTLINSTKDQLKQITNKINHENKELDIQTRITVEILPSFGSITPKSFTKRTYKKTYCQGLNDLQKRWKQHLLFRQQTAQLFNHKDRCRLFRQRTNTETVPQELHYIQQRYSIPLLCYDFRNLSKNQTLQTYL